MHIDLPQDIGLASEAKVESALVILQNEPQKHGLKFAIKRFIRARKHSSLDRNHIDFLVTLEEGRDVPLQVKSSERKARKFEQFCKRLGIFIPCIVVHFGETVESVIKQIVEKIKLAGNVMERQANRLVFLEKMREQKRERRARRRFSRFSAPIMCH